MIPKLKEFTIEELQEQLKDKKIDKEFLIEYIVERDKVYNQLIDKIHELRIQVSSREEVANNLQQRIDKAIEYINKNQLYNFDYDEEEIFEIVSDKIAKDYLLSILKGDLNE